MVKYKYIIQQNVVCLKKGEVIVWDKMYLMKCKSSKKLCKLLKIKQMYVNNFWKFPKNMPEISFEMQQKF